jgi:hypothetical protein
VPRIQGKLPFPSGEGWGEGLAREARKLHSSCFQDPAVEWRNQSRKCARRNSLTPTLSQREREISAICPQSLASLRVRSL